MAHNYFAVVIVVQYFLIYHLGACILYIVYIHKHCAQRGLLHFTLLSWIGLQNSWGAGNENCFVIPRKLRIKLAINRPTFIIQVSIMQVITSLSQRFKCCRVQFSLALSDRNESIN